VVTIAAVAIIAFSIGFASGGRSAAKASPSPSPPPAIVGASISAELHAAYLNVVGGNWAICSIAIAVTCQLTLAIPNIEFQDFDTLPMTVTATDWGDLSALRVPPGHYVLVGPMLPLAAEVALATIAANGDGTFVLGSGDQAVVDDVTYMDLGTLSVGRYVGVVRGFEVQAGPSEGQIDATVIGWAVGLVVGP
jgi:hypothetical protein